MFISSPPWKLCNLPLISGCPSRLWTWFGCPTITQWSDRLLHGMSVHPPGLFQEPAPSDFGGPDEGVSSAQRQAAWLDWKHCTQILALVFSVFNFSTITSTSHHIIIKSKLLLYWVGSWECRDRHFQFSLVGRMLCRYEICHMPQLPSKQTENWAGTELAGLKHQNTNHFILARLFRFLQLRSKHVVALSRNPNCKPRHEKVGATLFCRKKEEAYIDVKKDRAGQHAWDGHLNSAATFSWNTSSLLYHFMSVVDCG